MLTRVCRLWVMNHVDIPTTLPKLISPKQPRWSEITISPYATSNTGRPYEPIVLRNHHHVFKTSHQHKISK